MIPTGRRGGTILIEASSISGTGLLQAMAVLEFGAGVEAGRDHFLDHQLGFSGALFASGGGGSCSGGLPKMGR